MAQISLRVGYWCIGGVAVVILTSMLPGGSAEGGRLVCVVVWALVGLLGELFGLIRQVRGPGAVPRDQTPADGEVGVVNVEGFHIDPNVTNPRYGRLINIRSQDTRSSRLPIYPIPLLGRVVVVSIFLGRDGRSWDDREIALCLSSVESAAIWVEREAMRLRVPVNIDLCSAYLTGDDTAVAQDVDEHPIAAENADSAYSIQQSRRMIGAIMRVMSLAGFDTPAELLAEIQKRTQVDGVVGVVHPRSAGLSFAYNTEFTELRLGEGLAICYPRYADFEKQLSTKKDLPATDPATVAHELLHLFGATDKYDTALSRFPRGQVTSRDIMRLDRNTLSQLRIDPLTALEIGWNEVKNAVDSKKKPLVAGPESEHEGDM